MSVGSSSFFTISPKTAESFVNNKIVINDRQTEQGADNYVHSTFTKKF